MILVDKDIKNYVSENKLISQGYCQANLKGIAYELTISCICLEKEVSSYDLQPGEVVYIKTNEELNLPSDITGRIIERNSVMRVGLKVDGPQYIPGHKTYAFLRVQNISTSVFTLTKNFKIAQIMFEKLETIPELTYDKQESKGFADETKYVGLGEYNSEYSKLTKNFSSLKDEIESLKDKIYSNILTLMGIFVAIFTLISVNINAFATKDITANLIAKINLCLVSVLTVLLGLILLILNKGKKKWFIICYIILVAVLIAATVIVGIR